MRTSPTAPWTGRATTAWTFRDAWADATPLARGVVLGGVLLAFALLTTFYSVVAGAVHRAESGREQARVALDRQVVCSAFSATSSRDLCLVTVATHQAPATTRQVASTDRQVAVSGREVTVADRQVTRQTRNPVVHALYLPSAPANRQPTQLSAALY